VRAVCRRNLFISDETLERCKSILDSARNGVIPDGVTDEQLWDAKFSTLLHLCWLSPCRRPFQHAYH
jgi:hypothetical protein